jgi:hypothetical protein
MIWLTWRQHRIEMLVLGLVLAAMALYFILTGRAEYAGYNQVYNGMSAATCALQHRQDALCQTITTNFHNQFEDDFNAIIMLFIMPVLVGMFLGAPLVARELERGTYRLVWTQSVTRLRWMLVKVGAQAGAALLVFAVLTPIVLWWSGPFSGLLYGGMQNFDFVGIAPLAYMVYALALAIAAGTLLRKTVPAMFVTLVDYPAVRIPIAGWARPNYAPPVSATWDPYVTSPKVLQGSQDWILFQNFVDHSGHPIPDSRPLYNACAASGAPPAPHGQGTTVWNGLFTACTHAHGWLYTATWQPADRFWLFQGIESAIFFGLAAALLALAVWWVARG